MNITKIQQVLKDNPWIYFIIFVLLVLTIYYVSKSNNTIARYIRNSITNNFIYRRHSITTKFVDDTKPENKNIINVIIDPSKTNNEVIPDPERVVYQTEPIAPTKYEIITPEKNQVLPESNILDDYNNRSYVMITREGSDKDKDNKVPFLLEFMNLKTVFPSKQPDGTYKTEIKPLDKVENVYIQFYNNVILNVQRNNCIRDNEGKCLTYAEGKYKLLIGLIDTKGNFSEVSKFNFDMKQKEKEVLITLDKPILLNDVNKSLVVGLRKENEDIIYISEILFNFKGNFENVKKQLMLINKMVETTEPVIELAGRKTKPLKSLDDITDTDLKLMMIDEAQKCPTDHIYINTGDLSTSRCVALCKGKGDCYDQGAQFETGENTNEYRKIINPVCAITEFSTPNGFPISYCKPNIQTN